MKFTVDTGSTINIIDENTFKQLQNINLQKTHVRAYPFNSSEPVQMTGKFDTLIESRKRLTVATIYVTAQDGGRLLSIPQPGVRLDQSPSEPGRHTNKSIKKRQRNWSQHN